jgi:hypothetical protein
MVNESTVVVVVCVSFVNVIPKLSGRMNFGNKGYEPVSTPALCYAHCIGFGAWILVMSKQSCLMHQ